MSIRGGLADGPCRSVYKPLERTTEEAGSKSQEVGDGVEGGGGEGGENPRKLGLLEAVQKFVEAMHSGNVEDLEVI